MKILQLHPTLKCNQNCAWCTYKKKDVELPLWKIKKQLLSAAFRGNGANQGSSKKDLRQSRSAGVSVSSFLKSFTPVCVLRTGRPHRPKGSSGGCKILKVSGGGEPTMYPHLELMLKFASALGFVIYLQTNGSKLTQRVRELCHDVRISFGDGRPFIEPPIRPNGFSYVVSRCPDYDNLNTLLQYAVKNFLYVRITQDDTDIENVPSIEEIQANIVDRACTSGLLKDFGEYEFQTGDSELGRLSIKKYLIRFWDAKSFHPGKNPCPSWDSPVLGADGYYYPCCKTHVAKGIVKGYNETMRLGEQLPDKPYDGSECIRCYYGE